MCLGNYALHRDSDGIANDVVLVVILDASKIDSIDLVVLFTGGPLYAILKSIRLFPLGFLDNVGLRLANDRLNGLLEARVQEHGATETTYISHGKLLLLCTGIWGSRIDVPSTMARSSMFRGSSC